MPRPSAITPINIAIDRPTSWIHGEPNMPPALATSANSTDVARQCTRHSPDRPIAIRSSRLVGIASKDIGAGYNVTKRKLQYHIWALRPHWQGAAKPS